MTERIYVSRNAFLVAGIATLLASLALVWIAGTRDRTSARDRRPSSPEERGAFASPIMQPSKRQSIPASFPLVDHSIPAPPEFVKLTAAVSLHNSRGKEVKVFPAGKRLRVSNRAGDTITIDYLGDEYVIPKASTEPWNGTAN